MQPDPQPQLQRLDHLTFKGNLKQTRYGWLRLTPAYSVHLVGDILDRHWTEGSVVLDPFCGTGTTALVCAERGIACDTTDINPFLLWLAKAKATAYEKSHRIPFRKIAAVIGEMIAKPYSHEFWTPPLHQIEKWWTIKVLGALSRGMGAIREFEGVVEPEIMDLLKVAFCQTIIEHANVSFWHQSMSFRKKEAPDVEDAVVAETWTRAAKTVVKAARSPILTVPSAIHCDARDLRQKLPLSRYGCVITSPPYPNRMSYIRELRPYMYWLGYLTEGRQAGEMDWQAIGGTWGCATSKVAKWKPENEVEVPFDGYARIIERITQKSDVLGRYVAKYFHDMVGHCESLFDVVAPGGTVHYIVGNSKFYDVVLPVEQIYASMFMGVGFVDVAIEYVRKRTSKKELFEFIVHGRKPGAPAAG